jgi:type VI secretion system (T6SS) effector TldE1-like protein
MASDEASIETLLSRGHFGRSEVIALVLAALAVAAGAAAWVGAEGDPAPLVAAAVPTTKPSISFETRFAPASASATAYAERDAVQALDRFASRALNRQFLDARAALVRGMESRDSSAGDVGDADWRPMLTEGSGVAMPAPGVPLPRPRPAAANLPVSITASIGQVDSSGHVDDRSLLQKLSDLLPNPAKLASLTPEGGVVRSGIDLAALGYDRQTAVYDISAKMVYLPGGLGLEAHSGMGDLRDDPDSVAKRMIGATPPATYELKPREKLFHGVRALRMTAIDGTTLGRSGLLTHSYMLGPDGDSNGCVSIKNYDRFLRAYDSGEITRLVVVTSLETAVATRTAQKME